MSKIKIGTIGFVSIAAIAISACTSENTDADGAGGAAAGIGGSVDGGGGAVGNAGGGDPGAGGLVGNAGGALPGAGGLVGNAGGGDPGAGGLVGNAGGGDPGAGGGDPGAGGSDMGTGGAPPVDVLTVQLDNVKQIIRGFGINATIMPSGQSLPWNQLFTLEGADALGLSILRIGMDENGGHRSVPNDWDTVKGLDARVIGSCWSAPGNWKDNGKTTVGGHLLPNYYEDWATRIANYAKDNGLYAMSVGNETDFASCETGVSCNAPLTDEYESMVYTGAELAAFVKVAGPIFDSIAPDTKMIAPESSLWLHVWSNLSPDGTGIPGAGYHSSDPLNCNCFANTVDSPEAANCDPKCVNGPNGELSTGGYDYGHHLAADPDAWAAFDILGVHEYETQVGIAWPADVNGGVRDKEVWQTEMSGVRYWPEEGPSTHIENGVAVARWIHSALTVGEVSAWLYWWYESYYQNDNEGLAIIQGSNTIAKRYYTMGNFSRYIRPDVFHAVQVAGPSTPDIMVSAYLGDGGEVVIVAINETNAAADVPIAISGGTVPTAMVPIVTSASANWAEGTPVTVTDGSLPANLPAMSVTTFVSQ